MMLCYAGGAQALIAQSPFQYNRGVQATIKEWKGD